MGWYLVPGGSQLRRANFPPLKRGFDFQQRFLPLLGCGWLLGRESKASKFLQGQHTRLYCQLSPGVGDDLICDRSISAGCAKELTLALNALLTLTLLVRFCGSALKTEHPFHGFVKHAVSSNGTTRSESEGTIMNYRRSI
ncbi:hypothetical protein R1flu_016189 [Riccia fluitans]|uniref:Uncharacterized protein n=1 Tax=Riccia fluitans TaxID=41844 RepID=A0ABD1YL36_9MARC